MSNVAINIAAEFTGKAAFNKASKATTGLEKSVKKLGKSLGIALSVTAIAAFGKAAVKAFADDEKAAKQLANTLNNLGLAFATAQNEKFIQSLEASSNILDDVLRPSLQKLITTTGSLTYAQDLLTKATDISRGSGLDLATVANDLALAYVGNTRGLMKYGLGLTKAQLAAMSFEQIMAALNKQFAGANAAYLDTYAGKMDALNVASANAKETIGKGLLDAFTILAGGADSSITTVTDAIDDLATGIANVITGTAYYVKKLLDNPIVKNLLKAAYWLATHTGALSGVKRAADKGQSLRKEEKTPELTTSQKALLESQRKQAEANAKIVKAQKAATAEQKKQTALKKAGTVFDLEQIQLVAALKGKLSDNEKLRVEAQLALLNGNEAVATKLTNQILMAQDASGNLAKFLAALPNAKNPFEYLDAYLSYLAGKAAAVLTGSAYAEKGSYGGGGNTSVPPKLPDTNVPLLPSDNMITYNQQTGLNYNPNANNPVINVTVQGNVIREQELINQVLAGAQLSSLSGSPSQIGRIAGMFS
jgi:hypothetical protein